MFIAIAGSINRFNTGCLTAGSQSCCLEAYVCHFSTYPLGDQTPGAENTEAIHRLLPCLCTPGRFLLQLHTKNEVVLTPQGQLTSPLLQRGPAPHVRICDPEAVPLDCSQVVLQETACQLKNVGT